MARLFCITHVENVPSILKNSTLSDGIADAKSVQFTPIYARAIVSNRKAKQTRSWEFHPCARDRHGVAVAPHLSSAMYFKKCDSNCRKSLPKQAVKSASRAAAG